MKLMKKLIGAILAVFFVCAAFAPSITAAELEITGFESQKGRVYTVSEGGKLTVRPNGAFSQFNKYAIVYSSTEPLKGKISFSGTSEEFFLEAGENKTFSCLIDGYLAGKTETGIKSFTLETIQSVKADVSVISLFVEKVEKISGQTVYLQSDRYKLGVNLAWGGGISYLEDKKDGNTSISNLLNNHDTGRLVQQSYYGTKEAPYAVGDYNGVEWPYNPVQGGDLSGNASKLVDFEITDEYLYVKCRPLDWGHDNSITPSYMENTYKIDGDVVNVYNAFIDFSNYNNPKTTQELPAFYTISYLSAFCVYEGSKPWTDDTLTKKTDLGFWGEETGGNTEYLASNTETWSAWVDKNDWGIGLYVPNVTMLTAGRYNYDGSKSASSDSTNYVAPVRTMTLRFGEKIEYSYLITTGSLNTIRKTFKDNKDFTDNAGLRQTVSSDINFSRISFENDSVMALFTNKNECTVERDGAFAKLTAVNLEVNDPYTFFDYTGAPEPIDTTDKQFVVFTYMIPEENAGKAYTTEIFFGAGDQINPEGGKSKTVQTKADGEFHSLVFDLSGKSYWTGNINFIRIDFFSAATENDCMYVYSVCLAKDKEDADAVAAKEAAAANALLSSVETEAPATTEPTATLPVETAPVTTGNAVTNAPDTVETDGETAVSTDDNNTTGGNSFIYIIIAVAAAAVIAVIVIVLRKVKNK